MRNAALDAEQDGRSPRDRRNTTRRQVLRSVAAAAAATAFQAPFVRRSHAARSLRISTFGGDFERSFATHVYPAFTHATGIDVRSIEQPEGVQFLFQLAQANKAGIPPMDICCVTDVSVLRGRAQGLWHPLDASRIPNLSQIAARYVSNGPRGPEGVGAMAWYLTLVINPDEMTPLPDSWTVLWERRPNAWGANGGATSPLFEITARLYFGGTDLLSTKEGIDAVIGKIAEMKPNVKLWWQDEGTMQTALQNGEVIGGTYLHDVAMSMAKNGTPLRSIFPKEGAVQGANFWCQPSASSKTEEAQEFINFSCTPHAQALIARHVGSAPVMDRGKLDLTDAEFAAVSSDIPPIPLNADARLAMSGYMERQFTKMLTS